ncbi:oxidoreductase [Janthinobacterium sp. BJB412]|nr:oxidoreductase [Janthinobacterium sp. BJB412]
MRRLNLVGGGHVGGVLGRLFAQAGAFAVQDVLTRSPASARRAVEFIGAGRAVAGATELRPAEVLMLAVGDDQIAPACAALAAAVPLRGVVLFHCSGALASDQLAAARAAGALVASVHPIRSFADPAAVAASFAGTFCGVEGDAGALAVLEPALLALGARPVRIEAAAKTVYHAAAVFASNYLVTVLDAALRAYQAAGIPEEVARELARPLAAESMENVFRLGAAAALSGPIARGDLATVARQQRAVAAWDAPTGQLYQDLVAPTEALARRKKGA